MCMQVEIGDKMYGMKAYQKNCLCKKLCKEERYKTVVRPVMLYGSEKEKLYGRTV